MLANIHRKRGTEAIKPLELFPWHIEPRDPTKDSLAIKAAMARLAGRGKNG
jgi:hypothetical protein